MSWVALAWASQQRLERASDKLILLAYADRHNDETGFAYPSVQWLSDFSSLNRKTVIQCVDRLEKAGILTDSGRRVGATKQVKVYTVNVGEIQRVPKTGSSNSPTFSAEQSQKRDTEPSKEPISPNGENKTRASRRCPSDWKPDPDDYEVGFEDGLDKGEIIRALASFRDHTFVPPRSDWSATFRNWLRRAADDKRHRNARTKPSTKLDHLAAVARAMDAAVERPEGERRGDHDVSLNGGRMPRLISSA